MTARVKGPTDHVVVVGAGLAGLSAALRLAGAGRKVTVVEREAVPGGRNGLLNKSGFAFDTGPSVLTMPDLIADALACVGEDLKDWLDLVPLKPLYRAFYHDGSQLDVLIQIKCRQRLPKVSVQLKRSGMESMLNLLLSYISMK